MAPRHSLALLALPVILPLQSCCTIFGLFGCGTGVPIAKISWDSPRESLDTLLAAIRASDVKVIYEALSEGFKQANGFDGLGFAIAWEKLRDQVPGLHLAGDAEIVEEGPGRDATGQPINGRYRYLLDAHGYRFEVEFGRRAYWELAAKDPNSGETQVLGTYVRDLDDHVDVAGIKGAVNARIKSPELVGLDAETFRNLKIGWAFKVRKIARVAD